VSQSEGPLVLVRPRSRTCRRIPVRVRLPRGQSPTYARIVHERDEAIAGRDFILKFLQDMGTALAHGDALAA
jgi:hypothetical protein